MKVLAAALLLASSVAMAQPAPHYRLLTISELRSIKLNDGMCPDKDSYIAEMEDQLTRKGIGVAANPESLSKEDTEFNAAAKILIWSLRVGCANPDRYKK